MYRILTGKSTLGTALKKLETQV